MTVSYCASLHSVNKFGSPYVNTIYFVIYQEFRHVYPLAYPDGDCNFCSDYTVQEHFSSPCTNLPRNYLNDIKFGADEKEFHFTSQMQREELLRSCFPSFPHNIWIQGFWIIIMKDLKELMI